MAGQSLRVYFLRHGESEANLAGEFSNRGWRHPLTTRGRVQVETLAERLQEHPIRAIFCSPILRAIQSAQLLSMRLGVDYEVVEALREYDVGSFEGTRDSANWEEYERVVRRWLLGGEKDLRTGGGESLTEIEDRFGSFVFGLPGRFPDGGDVILVAHGGLFRSALPHVLANVSARYSYANVVGHVAWVMAEFRDGDLVCRDWADTHLEPDSSLDLDVDSPIS